MTKSEYQELVEFIAPRFDRMDKRFDVMDSRFDAADERSDGFEQRLRRVEILAEDTRDQVRIVAGGVTTVDRKLEEFRSEVADSFREHRDLLRNSYRDLDLGMTSVEERFDRREAD